MATGTHTAFRRSLATGAFALVVTVALVAAVGLLNWYLFRQDGEYRWLTIGLSIPFQLILLLIAVLGFWDVPGLVSDRSPMIVLSDDGIWDRQGGMPGELPWTQILGASAGYNRGLGSVVILRVQGGPNLEVGVDGLNRSRETVYAAISRHAAGRFPVERAERWDAERRLRPGLYAIGVVGAALGTVLLVFWLTGITGVLVVGAIGCIIGLVSRKRGTHRPPVNDVSASIVSDHRRAVAEQAPEAEPGAAADGGGV